jgi:hypothetical protein
MKFKRVDVQPSVVSLARWDEQEGVWFLNAAPVLYGVRLHVCVNHERDEAGSIEMVYCMGRGGTAHLLVPGVVAKALESLPGTATCPDVRRHLPHQARKPMCNDPECWTKLCELAGVPELARTLISAAAGEGYDELAADVAEQHAEALT